MATSTQAYDFLLTRSTACRPKRPMDMKTFVNLAEEFEMPEQYIRYHAGGSEITYANVWRAISPYLPGDYLDVGSGYGDLCVVAARSGCRVSAVDFWMEIPQPVLEKHAIRFHRCHVECESLPFEDESFDVVTFMDVLEHLNYSPLIPLREMHRVLRRGGVLALTTPNVAALRERLRLLRGRNIFPPLEDYTGEPTFYKGRPYFDRHVRLYTDRELQQLLKDLHFTNVTTRFITSRRKPRSLWHQVEDKLAMLRDAVPSFRKTILVQAQK